MCAGNIEVATIGVTVETDLTVGLDPKGDGIGGLDHEVLLDGTMLLNIDIIDKIKVRNVAAVALGHTFWVEQASLFNRYLRL